MRLITDSQLRCAHVCMARTAPQIVDSHRFIAGRYSRSYPGLVESCFGRTSYSDAAGTHAGVDRTSNAEYRSDRPNLGLAIWHSRDSARGRDPASPGFSHRSGHQGSIAFFRSISASQRQPKFCSSARLVRLIGSYSQRIPVLRLLFRREGRGILHGGDTYLESKSSSGGANSWTITQHSGSSDSAHRFGGDSNENYRLAHRWHFLGTAITSTDTPRHGILRCGIRSLPEQCRTHSSNRTCWPREGSHAQALRCRSNLTRSVFRAICKGRED